jgi:hypothetical protein
LNLTNTIAIDLDCNILFDIIYNYIYALGKKLNNLILFRLSSLTQMMNERHLTMNLNLNPS